MNDLEKFFEKSGYEYLYEPVNYELTENILDIRE